MIRVTGSQRDIVFEAPPVDDPNMRRPDIRRARQVLGWEPGLPFEQGLKRLHSLMTDMPAEEPPVQRIAGPDAYLRGATKR